MSTLHAALYARVSSEQQADAHTVASQVAALQDRVATDGLVLPEGMQFLDEGYSGATLVRPALERLRDLSTWTKVLPHFTLLENQSCISFQTVGESLRLLRTDVGMTHKPKMVANNTL